MLKIWHLYLNTPPPQTPKSQIPMDRVSIIFYGGLDSIGYIGVPDF